MSDTAAHLVDRVFPEVPVRQWVLTLPYTLRFRMAYDSKLVADIQRIFVQTVFASLRRKAGNGKKLKCGAVTVGGAEKLVHNGGPSGAIKKVEVWS
jgi:hypothetical protein